MSGELLALYTIGILALLGISSFFSGAETALFSLSRAQAKRLSQGSLAERTATRLLREPQRLLSTILVGNMAVNVLIASLIAGIVRELSGPRSAALAIAVTTLLLLIFGEITPKTVAVRHAEVWARAAALPLQFFGNIIAPARWLLRRITNTLLALLGQRGVTGWGLLTREEVANLLAVGAASGATTDRERELAERILNFTNVEAHDIMVPRTDVDGVSDDLRLGAAFERARRLHRSRVPVFHQDLDDIWGILSVVDLPRWRGSALMEARLETLRPPQDQSFDYAGSPLHPVHLVPETAHVEQLLGRMRRQRSQMVVLLDEYGGTAGILTLRDILAEIVGQLTPAAEHAPLIHDAGDGVFLVDGRTHVRTFNQETAMNVPREEADTVAGYVMDLLGRLPRAGDEVRDEQARFRVVRMAGRRVDMIRVEKVPSAAPEGGADV